jgi:hypothetical protein
MGMSSLAPEGIGIRLPPGADSHHVGDLLARFLRRLGAHELAKWELLTELDGQVWWVRLRKSLFDKLLPGHDALGLRERLVKSTGRSGDDLLMQEIWVTLLSAPSRIDFADLQEFESHMRIRCNIARAAELTALAFKTDAAERPSAFWRDDPDVGFLLKPAVSLTDALIAATQPERTGRLYDFSCYRATEYVILLGIAQEARSSQPKLYEALESTTRTRCIKSGLFHDVFLTEYGSVDAPLPMNYYIPGDRVWFKNPDEQSSNIHGYEGSWVIYLGGGRFSNFWKRDAPYTLNGKMLEIYHWRHGASLDHQSNMQMNEDEVHARVATTRGDRVKRQRVLKSMARYRDPAGVYGAGGCIDSSREFPRELYKIAIALN